MRHPVAGALWLGVRAAARGIPCIPPSGTQPLGLLLLSGSALRGLQTASGGRCLGRRGGDHQRERGSSSLLAALLNSYNYSVALVNKAALPYLILHIFEIKKEAVGVVSKCLFKSQITGSEIQSQGAAFKGILLKLALSSEQQCSLEPGEWSHGPDCSVCGHCLSQGMMYLLLNGGGGMGI